jgi:hypothetical protein
MKTIILMMKTTTTTIIIIIIITITTITITIIISKNHAKIFCNCSGAPLLRALYHERFSGTRHRE